MRNSKNEVPNFPCHAIGEAMCSVEESNLSDSDFFLFSLAVLDLHCCTGFSLVVVSGDYSLVAMCGLLIAVASLVWEHGLYGAWAQ